MRSFSASLISGLNYFCVDSVQKPSTFKPPLQTALPWEVNAWHAPSTKTKPTHCFPWRGEEVNAAPADAEAGWQGDVSPCVTGTRCSGWEQRCSGWRAPSPRIPLRRWHLALLSFVPKMSSVGTLAQRGEVIMQPSPCCFHRYLHRAGVRAPPAALPEGLGRRW